MTNQPTDDATAALVQKADAAMRALFDVIYGQGPGVDPAHAHAVACDLRVALAPFQARAETPGELQL